MKAVSPALTAKAARLFRHRTTWIALAAIALLLVLFFMLGSEETPAGEEKPAVGYMSSLPLAFGEGGAGAVLQGESSADPFYLRLAEEYRMQPIDDLESLPDVDIAVLMLIQPRGFNAAENVALDRWVRAGGNLVFLTDPALMRESGFPLGDKRRPLFTSMASPVLSHWGLELTLPMDEVQPRVERTVGDESFETRAPGAFRRGKGGGNADCVLMAAGLAARCDIGAGRALLLADADMIDPALWQESGWLGDEDGAVRLIESYLAEMTGKQP